ncbi:MAG: putative toxin-antitoxin system toxin component, PIN family [Elusimicrobia bacterium]|nr:putative toxin-antitoxin system toxin component, PIN family [Elusimicrobiota bacterium]
MKVVLDTNVLISGLLWRGKPNRLLKAIEEGHLTLCSSKHLAEELGGVLKRKKFAGKLAERNTSVDQVLEIFEELAHFYPDLPIPPVIKEDPSDDKVLACALSSGAEWIISGDPHLLRLKSYERIEILSPDQALRKLPL